MTQRESKDASWDAVSAAVSSLLQDDDADLPRLAPFDATLQDVEVDDQKVGAVYRIQRHLQQKEVAPALSLLRSAREVWPEGEVFGAEDAEAEDEFMTLREILFAEVERPGWLPVEEGARQAAEQGDDQVENEEEEGNEEEEEEEESQQVETYVTEQEFDFKGFVLRFAVKSVSAAYAHLFKKFLLNLDFTNHCIVKMFHRIAFDCKMPALLYQVGIFRTFQQVQYLFKSNLCK